MSSKKGKTESYQSPIQRSSQQRQISRSHASRSMKQHSKGSDYTKPALIVGGSIGVATVAAGITGAYCYGKHSDAKIAHTTAQRDIKTTAEICNLHRDLSRNALQLNTDLSRHALQLNTDLNQRTLAQHQAMIQSTTEQNTAFSRNTVDLGIGLSGRSAVQNMDIARSTSRMTSDIARSTSGLTSNPAGWMSSSNPPLSPATYPGIFPQAPQPGH